MSVSTLIHIYIVDLSTEDNPEPTQKYTYNYSMDTGVYQFFNLGPFGPNIYANKLMNIDDMHNI